MYGIDEEFSSAYKTVEIIPVTLFVKDARSVSLYPYNRSQILQYVKNTKKIPL